MTMVVDSSLSIRAGLAYLGLLSQFKGNVETKDPVERQ